MTNKDHIMKREPPAPRCVICARPLERHGAECLHGLAPVPEPWDGGLNMTPAELMAEYGYSQAEAEAITSDCKTAQGS